MKEEYNTSNIFGRPQRITEDNRRNVGERWRIRSRRRPMQNIAFSSFPFGFFYLEHFECSFVLFSCIYSWTMASTLDILFQNSSRESIGEFARSSKLHQKNVEEVTETFKGAVQDMPESMVPVFDAYLEKYAEAIATHALKSKKDFTAFLLPILANAESLQDISKKEHEYMKSWSTLLEIHMPTIDKTLDQVESDDNDVMASGSDSDDNNTQSVQSRTASPSVMPKQTFELQKTAPLLKKARVAMSVGAQVKAFDDIVSSSRDFIVEGAVVFLSCGERSKNGDAKRDITLRNDDGQQLSIFLLGQKPCSAWKDVMYGAQIRTGGYRPQRPGGKYSKAESTNKQNLYLTAYKESSVTVEKIVDEISDYAMLDPVRSAKLSDAVTASDKETFQVVAYVVAIHATGARKFQEDKSVKVREVTIRDAANSQTLAVELDTCVGSLKANAFVVLKKGLVFRGELQLWPYSMISDAPIPMRFAVDSEATEL